MKKISLLIIVVLFISACKKEAVPPIVYTSKKFDIEKYSHLLKAQDNSNNYRKDTIIGDTTIVVFKSGRHFFEQKWVSNTAFFYLYDKASFKLLEQSTLLYGLRTGFTRKYSLEGKLTSEVNEDEGYGFNIPQLKQKIMKDYTVDIGDNQHVYLSKRKTLWGTRYYDVRISGRGNDYTEIKIHGTTGEFLGQEKGRYEE